MTRLLISIFCGFILACNSPAVKTEPTDTDRTKNNDTHNVYRDSSRLKKTDTIYPAEQRKGNSKKQ